MTNDIDQMYHQRYDLDNLDVEVPEKKTQTQAVMQETDPLTEKQLLTDKNFQEQAAIMYAKTRDAQKAGLAKTDYTGFGSMGHKYSELDDPEDIADWAVNHVSWFRNNATSMMMDMAKLSKADPDLVVAFSNVNDMYSATPDTGKQFARGTAQAVLDPFNLLGVSAIAKTATMTTAGKELAASQLSRYAQRIVATRAGRAATTTAVAASEGAAFSGGFTYGEEKLGSMATGEDVDMGAVKMSAGVGAVAAPLLVGGAIGAKKAYGVTKDWIQKFKVLRGEGQYGGNTFTDSPMVAQSYAQNHEGGQIVEKEIEAKFPATLSKETMSGNELASELDLDIQLGDEAVPVNQLLDQPEVIDAIEGRGIDMIAYPEIEPKVERTIKAIEKNELGLYSGTEKALLDMSFPQWSDKNLQTDEIVAMSEAGGRFPLKSRDELNKLNTELKGKVSHATDFKVTKPVSGNEIWSKFQKSAGVKKDELQALGLEKFLTKGGYRTSSKDPTKNKFTQEEVQDYIRTKAVKVDEVVGVDTGAVDTESINNEIYQALPSYVSEHPDMDSDNWQHIIDDAEYEFDNGVYEHHFWGDSESDEALVNSIDFNEMEYVIEDPAELIEYQQGGTDEKLAILSNHLTQDDLVSAGGESYKNIFLGAADAAAEEQYKDAPYASYQDSIEVGGETFEISVIGNEEIGFSIKVDGEDVASEIYSETEVDIQIQDRIMDLGEFNDHNGDPESAALKQYFEDDANFDLTPYDNYREVKLSLPEVEGDDYTGSHWSNEPNIFASMIVTDRDIKTPDGDATAFFIEETQSDWYTAIRKQTAARSNRAGTLLELRKDRMGLARQLKDLDLDKYAPMLSMRSDNGVYNQSDLQRKLFGYESGAEDSTAAARDKIMDDIGVDRWSQISSHIERMNEHKHGLARTRMSASKDTPDMPFKGDAWMNLTMKRALLAAKEEGKSHLAWSNASHLAERWGHGNNYAPQYDRKMVSAIKKLTGQKPIKTYFNEEHQILANADPDHIWFTTDGDQKMVHLKGHYDATTGDTLMIVDAGNDADALREVKSKLAKSAGYWQIPLKGEKIERGMSEGMPLFSTAALSATVGLQALGVDSEQDSLDQAGASTSYRTFGSPKIQEGI